jgi:hypothetical protein
MDNTEIHTDVNNYVKFMTSFHVTPPQEALDQFYSYIREILPQSFRITIICSSRAPFTPENCYLDIVGPEDINPYIINIGLISRKFIRFTLIAN